ncbi:hypothetical protein L1049_015585 [Liquidambar formosana]|uniref:Uncharacterized protein n=1 Tax=Liquidambar formosana TaxID=63359 RepID=A0AAP0RZ48_LIQFO
MGWIGKWLWWMILFYMSWWSFRRMSDAQIATTIGHEVGLAVSRHYAENWIKLFWAICLLSILSNFFPINRGHGNFFHPIHLWHSRRYFSCFSMFLKKAIVELCLSLSLKIFLGIGASILLNETELYVLFNN